MYSFPEFGMVVMFVGSFGMIMRCVFPVFCLLLYRLSCRLSILTNVGYSKTSVDYRLNIALLPWI